MNARVRAARDQGLSKREAKHAVYGHVSRHRPTRAPTARYRRLSVRYRALRARLEEATT